MTKFTDITNNDILVKEATSDQLASITFQTIDRSLNQATLWLNQECQSNINKLLSQFTHQHLSPIIITTMDLLSCCL